MEDFENEKKGELGGFDFVSGQENSVQNETNTQGFYNKPHEEIIQDNIKESEAEQGEEKKEIPVAEKRVESTYTPPRNFYKPAKKEKKPVSAATVAICCILSVVIGAVSGFATANLGPKTSTPTPQHNITPNNVNINIDETAESVVEAVAQKVTPSVIGIRTTTSVMNFFGGSSEATGEGSGVVYSADGYIITNYHVIKEALTNKSGSKIEVFVDSNSSEPYSATVVGYNISSDLAVIKIDAANLTAVEIADSDNLKVGQYVITVGNPGGLEFMDSVTYGVISGLERVVSSDSGIELIQTDAAINPGNSGGALVNTKGELVGINSSKIVSEEFEGMGFAIPSNTVVQICNNIIAKENSPEPYIGISISEKYTANVLRYYGFPAGAVVLSVADGSPASDAGIEKGDIITKFNGVEITEYPVLEKVIGELQPNDKVSVTIYRNGRYYTTKITIGSNNQIE